MESFHALGSQEGSTELVMVGISKALLATAVGLIVAIPSYHCIQLFTKATTSDFYPFKLHERGCSFLCKIRGKCLKNKSHMKTNFMKKYI